MNKFKTLVDLDLLLDRTDNYDIVNRKVELEWNLEIEMREYGVKNFTITVPDQTFSVELNVWGDEDDTKEDITLNVKDVFVDHAGHFDSIIPTSLELFKGKWTLVFQ